MSYREELIVRVTGDGTAEVIHSGLTEPKVLRPGDTYKVVWSAGLTYECRQARCGGSRGNPRPVDRGPGPDGMGRLPSQLCPGCPDCTEEPG